MSSETTNVGLLGTLIERWRRESAIAQRFALENRDAYAAGQSHARARDADELEAALATLPQQERPMNPGYVSDEGDETEDDFPTALPPAPPQTQEQKAWLVELGSMPTQWWTGRGDEWTPYVDGLSGKGADCAMRFARREDAERAIGWLLNKHVARGCKATEHIWLAASPPAQEQEQPAMCRFFQESIDAGVKSFDAKSVQALLDAVRSAIPPAHGWQPIEHGKNCEKVKHLGGGYLHGDDDDRPYDVDGVLYCGRCHVAVGR